MSNATTYKLPTGYAYTSTRRYPTQPETVVVGETESSARFIGPAWIDNQQYCAFRFKGRYYFVLATSCPPVELPYSEFRLSDVDNRRVYASRDELHYDPPQWLAKGLTQTQSGYGSKLNSGLKIYFEGKLRRVYITQYSNAGTAWFMFRGERIIVS